MDPKEQLVVSRTADPGVASLIQARSHTFVEIDHEIISMAVLPFLIQERLLSVSSESMRTCKPLSQVCLGKSVVRRTGHLDMTIAVD